MEPIPAGCLLRDPRNADALDIRLVSADEQHIVVSTGGSARRYLRREARLQRWLLPPRTAVATRGSTTDAPLRAAVVLRLDGEAAPGSLWRYVVQTEAGQDIVSEERLQVLKIDCDDPLERLELNSWRGPRRFFARLCVLDRTTVWKQDSEGIPAFLGARVDPLFHQFYAARRVLNDREPRFLLADEVGLGKTIEAGLVIQSLLGSRQDLRVLIVAPGTTSRQWLSEMYGRFGARVFTHVDAVRYERGEAGNGRRAHSVQARDALLKQNLLIVTTSLLRGHPKALARVANQDWDLLVVDEGHHLANWPGLADQLRSVSSRSSGCLVLTATPGRGDDRGLLELLRLVAPATYGDVSETQFRSRLGPQREILGKLNFSEELLAALQAQGGVGPDDARELASDWRGFSPDDPVSVECLRRMEDGDGDAAEELVAHIQENYRVDRRIVRTRRRTLGEYGVRHAPRTVEQLEYEACAAEAGLAEHVEELEARGDVPGTWKAIWGRLACSTPGVFRSALEVRAKAIQMALGPEVLPDPLESDLGPAEEEAAIGLFLAQGPIFPGEAAWLETSQHLSKRWLEMEPGESARLRAVREWIARRLAGGTRKVVVFSQSRPVALECCQSLRTNLGRDFAALSVHTMQDDEIAEVARRFQKDPRCRVLVSDELGAEGRNFQFADAVIHLDQPWLAARLEQRIGRLDRVGRLPDDPVLSVAVTGPLQSEVALFELQRKVFRVYERSIGGLEYLLPRVQRRVREAMAGGTTSLRALAGPLRAELEEEESRVDEAFAFFLDATRPELERAKELAELVAERTGEEDAQLLRDWCRELQIDVIPQQGNSYKIEVRNERLERPLPTLGAGDSVRVGTFDRRAALESESLQYFAPGHVLVDALVESALETSDARASAFFRDLGGLGANKVFALVIGRLEPDASVWPEGVTPGLRRRAESYLPPEWVRVAWEVMPDGQVAIVPPGRLLESLHQDHEKNDRKCSPEHMTAVLERFPDLWSAVRSAARESSSAITKRKEQEVDAAAEMLEEDLRDEVAYLRARAVSHPSGTAASDLAEREALVASVRHPGLSLDSVAVIIGTGAR